MFRYDTDWL